MTIFIPIWVIIASAVVPLVALIGLLIGFICQAACRYWLLAVEWWTKVNCIHRMICKFMKENPDMVQKAREGKLK